MSHDISMIKKTFVFLCALFLLGCGNNEEGQFDNIAQRLETERGKLDGLFPETRKVYLTEFFDFGCSHCAQAHNVLKKLEREFNGQLIVEKKHYSIYPEYKIVAEASECSRNQGKFEDFHNLYFDEYFGETDPEILQEMILQLNLNLNDFIICLESGATKDKIEMESRQAKKYGAKGTPFFVINEDTTIPGLLPEGTFRNLIENLLEPESNEENPDSEK